MSLTANDFTPLLKKSEDISSSNQKSYLLYVFFDLLLAVIISIITSISLTDPEFKKYIAIVTLLLFVISLFITFSINSMSFDKNWFSGRALAESIKTTSWRYSMGAEPFQKNLTDDKVDDAFCEQIKEIIKDAKTMNSSVTLAANETLITQKMKDVRAMLFSERLKIYTQERINDQKTWYSNKTTLNERGVRIWFNAIVVAQFIGIAGAVIQINNPDFPIALSSIFASVTAAFIAWIQLKQHRNLVSAYSIANFELAMIEQKASRISQEDQFSVFVADAENAISREHTFWKVRRDVI